MKHEIKENITKTHITIYFFDDEIINKLLDMADWNFLYIHKGKRDFKEKADLIINTEKGEYRRNLVLSIYNKDSVEAYYLEGDNPEKRKVILFLLPYLSLKTRTAILLFLEDENEN